LQTSHTPQWHDDHPSDARPEVFQFQFAAREADDIEIKVRKTPLSASRLYLETNIYLDRLGTNIGKTQ
jgi:hypothetical protein